MRVFQLNTFCGIKSTGRIATDIAQLLEKQGDECLIGFGAETVPPNLARFSYRIGTSLERKVHGAIRKFLDAEGYGSLLATWKLIRKLRQFQPDVVHLHNLHGCYVNLGVLFWHLKKTNVPVAWTLHDCWPFTGHCAYFDFACCKKWKTECEHCPELHSYPTCLWWDGSQRNYRHKQRLFTSLPNIMLVPPSHWLEGLLSESFLKAYPVSVIPNGVAQQVFSPADAEVCKTLRDRYGLLGKRVVLAVAAVWDERKGLPYLLEAARFLEKDFQVVVLGLSPKQITELPKVVLGLPPTDSVQELVNWYSLADCLANPTMEDNMPMVNLEALACGTPVVVFATGGCVEVIDDGCGCVVPQGDAAALAQAVSAIAPNKAAFSQGCQARAEKWSADKCYGQYLALYKELCP